MAVLKNRAKMSTSSTGTGTIALGSAETGYQSFADAGVANSDVVRYVIEDGNDWEIGAGTYTSSGTTLSRVVSESSNSGAALNLSGSATVFITAAAEDLPNLYADNPVSAVAPTASGNNAVAIGEESTASGTDSISLGSDSDATQNESSALGKFAQATGSGSVSLGARSVASGQFSVALGGYTDATSTNSIAIGYPAQAVTGSGATAIGNSYASGADSFSAVITNNTSSYGATGASGIALGKLAKASGAYSTAIGESTQATSSNSVCLGYYSQSTAQGSVAIGYDAQATAAKSFSFGLKVRNAIQNAFRFAGGHFSSAGDAQSGIYILRSDTTDATAEALTTNNSTASTDNQIILANEAAMTFTGTVVVREDATDGDDYAGWEIKGVIMRQGQASDTALGTGIVNSLYHTAGLANAAVALFADTTNGGLKIQVTGIASTNLNWVATVHTSEVVNA